MRAGLLSSPEIVEKLKKDYVCTWALPSVVRELAQNSKSAETKAFATTLFLNFRPLVEISVVKPDGTLVKSLSMNDDIIEPFPTCLNPDRKLLDFFLGFLEEGLN